MTDLVHNVRALRQEAGLSQAELANRVGVSQTWISRLELGQGNPTLSTLNRLAEAFDVRIADLLGEQAA
jgi:XRE family transcriptional regulator, regulator of sulfur utilization